MGSITPGEYKNKSRGRVLNDISNPNSESFHFYEDTYQNIRNAFEVLRTQDAPLFVKTLDHVRSRKELKQTDLQKASAILQKEGVFIASDEVRKVVQEWATANPAFGAQHEPDYMLDVGVPVRKEWYKSVAQKIDDIRLSHPHFSKPLDDLIKGDRTGQELLYSASWYTQSVKDDPKMAKAFERAVAPLSGLEIKAAQAYVRSIPALDAG